MRFVDRGPRARGRIGTLSTPLLCALAAWVVCPSLARAADEAGAARSAADAGWASAAQESPPAEPPAVSPPAQSPPTVPPRSARFINVRLEPATIRPRTRARLRFLLTSETRVQLKLDRQVLGRVKRGSRGCEQRTRRNARNPPCSYFLPLPGRRLVAGRAGSNQVTLTRRFAGRVLKAGVYRLTLRAASGDLTQLVFKVLRR